MSAQHTPRPRSAPFVTFGELLAYKHTTTVGRCRFCERYHVEGVYYSTRAGCCLECAAARRDEVMPAVAKAERKALRMAVERVQKGNADSDVVWWVRHFAKVNTAFAEWAVAQAKAGAS